MKKLFCLFLVLLSTTLLAQEEKTVEFPNAKRSYITFDITTAIDFINPRYRFGYIQSIHKNWKIGADIGYGNETISLNEYREEKNKAYQLFEIRTEVYHVFNPTRKVNHYISGELYYINHTEERFDDYFDLKNENIRVRYEKARMERQKQGFNLKYGVFLPFGKSVGMNLYCGLGIRIKNIDYTHVIGEETTTNYDDDDDHYDFLFYNYDEVGKKTGLNVSLGAKFFYAFH